MKTIIYTILITLLFCSCNSPQKILERGDYEEALRISLRKLKHGKVKTDHLFAMEKSFRLATLNDAEKIQKMRTANNTAVWPRIYQEGLSIAERQAKVEKTIHTANKSRS